MISYTISYMISYMISGVYVETIRRLAGPVPRQAPDSSDEDGERPCNSDDERDYHDQLPTSKPHATLSWISEFNCLLSLWCARLECFGLKSARQCNKSSASSMARSWSAGIIDPGHNKGKNPLTSPKTNDIAHDIVYDIVYLSESYTMSYAMFYAIFYTISDTMCWGRISWFLL